MRRRRRFTTRVERGIAEIMAHLSSEQDSGSASEIYDPALVNGKLASDIDCALEWLRDTVAAECRALEEKKRAPR